MGLTPEVATGMGANAATRESAQTRWSWLAPRLIVAGATAFVVAMVVLYWREQPTSFGYDYSFYLGVGLRWVDMGVYYVPYQLAGPYPFHDMVDNLYPPTALFLFVPAAFTPAITWWLMPAALLTYALRKWRPSPWTWVAIALLMCWPKSYIAWIFGNTEIWVMAAVASGLLWGWPAASIAFLKPVFAPFGVVGIRRRSWWMASAGLAVVSLVMLSMWLDYVAVIANVRMESDLIKFQGLPMLFIPVIAWLGRSSPSRQNARASDAPAMLTST